MVEYANRKEAGDHVTIDQKLIPVQWMLWLRHTRADPPSIPVRVVTPCSCAI